MFAKEITAVEGILGIVVGVIICILAWTFGFGSFHDLALRLVAFLSGLFLSSIGIVRVISKTLSKSRTYNKPDAVYTFRIIPWLQLIYTIGLLFSYTYHLLVESYEHCLYRDNCPLNEGRVRTFLSPVTIENYRAHRPPIS
jgi:hypothetical protein